MLQNERYTGGILDGLGVMNIYDGNLLLRTNLLTPAGNAAYTYGSGLRLFRVTSGANTFSYQYYADTPALVKTILFTNASSGRLTSNYDYDKLMRLTNVNSTMNGTLGSQFVYQYNMANQRTRRTELDSTYWVYQYDALGQRLVRGLLVCGS